jgi:hypothetical protein
MASIFAEKRPETSSRTFANQNDGKNGISMPAIPALQKKDGLDEEEKPAMMKTMQKAGGPEEEEKPVMTKMAQLKSGTIQKAGGPEEEEKPVMTKMAQLKSGTIQKAGGPEEEEKPVMTKMAQLKSDTLQKQSADDNKTGLPDNLKSGVEQLSGYSLSDVKVHYNSSQPAQLNALAYAQGTDIHVAPGQEKHLPHEAWHVAQQKQGRVQPTTQAKGVAVNDDKGLESEADTMGAKAVQMAKNNTAIAQREIDKD